MHQQKVLGVFLQAHLRSVIRELRTSDIRVSLFIDPQLDQVKMARRIEADAVEFNTGVYADLNYGSDPGPELERLPEAGDGGWMEPPLRSRPVSSAQGRRWR